MSYKFFKTFLNRLKKERGTKQRCSSFNLPFTAYEKNYLCKIIFPIEMLLALLITTFVMVVSL